MGLTNSLKRRPRVADDGRAIDAVNAEHVRATVYGLDPWGASQAFGIAAVAQRANAGANAPTTTNPVNTFNGDAVVPVQAFLGAGQLEANLGAARPDNNPVVAFHSTDSSPLLDDPVMTALLDQTARGVT